MKIGIIGAMDIEIEKLIDNLDGNSKEININGFTYYTGKMNDIDLVITACSIGKVNAALGTQTMLSNFEIDYLLHTGIAGGLDDSLNHLSVVIGDKLTYHDVADDIKLEFFPKKEYFESDKNLIGLAKDSVIKNNYDYNIGTIVSGDQFIEDNKIKAKIHNKFEALCVEMEGAAIANAAYINDIPFVVIRCISDLADDASDEDYNNFKPLAAERSANIILDIVKNIK